MSYQTDVATEANDIVLSRFFDAPRPLVFMAWVDPVMLAEWWGPEGFTATVDIDVREGGEMSLVMHSPDGEDYPIGGHFGEIVPNESLVMIMDASRHSEGWHEAVKAGFVEAGGRPEDYNADPIRTLITFADEGAGTRVIVRQTFTMATMRDAHVRLGSGVGWSGSFNKLDAVLQQAGG
ncbi:SRPBCC domain-containing protein [Asticcacaulis taihuensis]|uniref:SRPBCC domain-containing protein n=1 Tax=Asticcacaulis taihuensis TaxID=260084 RepID=UPI003F7BA403